MKPYISYTTSFFPIYKNVFLISLPPKYLVEMSFDCFFSFIFLYVSTITYWKNIYKTKSEGNTIYGR